MPGTIAKNTICIVFEVLNDTLDGSKQINLNGLGKEKNRTDTKSGIRKVLGMFFAAGT